MIVTWGWFLGDVGDVFGRTAAEIGAGVDRCRDAERARQVHHGINRGAVQAIAVAGRHQLHGARAAPHTVFQVRQRVRPHRRVDQAAGQNTGLALDRIQNRGVAGPGIGRQTGLEDDAHVDAGVVGIG